MDKETLIKYESFLKDFERYYSRYLKTFEKYKESLSFYDTIRSRYKTTCNEIIEDYDKELAEENSQIYVLAHIVDRINQEKSDFVALSDKEPNDITTRVIEDRLRNILVQLLQTLHISNNDIIEALEEKTGKKWSCKKITGITGYNEKRCGLCLISEDNELFNQDIISIVSYPLHKSILPEDESLIVCFNGSIEYSINYYNFQESLKHHNWILSYLKNKDMLPPNVVSKLFHSTPEPLPKLNYKDIPDGGPYKDFITSIIDEKISTIMDFYGSQKQENTEMGN